MSKENILYILMRWEKLKHMSWEWHAVTYHYLTTSQSSHCIKLKRKCRSEWEFANPRTPAFLFQVAFHQNVGGSEGHMRTNPQCQRVHGPQGTPPRHLTHLGAQSWGGDTPQRPPTECWHHTLDRMPWLTELYNQGQSQNGNFLKQTWSQFSYYGTLRLL